MSLNTEWATVITMVLCGMGMGMAFDSYRLVKKRWKWIKGLVVFFIDLCFWIFSTSIVFLILYYVNNGLVRFYIFVMIILGIFVYFRFLSKFYQHVFSQILNLLSSFFHLMGRCLHWTIIQPIIWLYQLIAFIVTLLITPIYILFRWGLGKGEGFFRWMAKLFRQERDKK